MHTDVFVFDHAGARPARRGLPAATAWRQATVCCSCRVCVWRVSLWTGRCTNLRGQSAQRRNQNPESIFLLAQFMNPWTWIQRNPRGLPMALAKWSPGSLNPWGGNEYRIRDCPRRCTTRAPWSFSGDCLAPSRGHGQSGCQAARTPRWACWTASCASTRRYISLYGLARCGTVFSVSAVVGAAVPAAVCRWGLCPCCPGVGRCLLGVYNHHHHLYIDR